MFIRISRRMVKIFLVQSKGMRLSLASWAVFLNREWLSKQGGRGVTGVTDRGRDSVTPIPWLQKAICKDDQQDRSYILLPSRCQLIPSIDHPQQSSKTPPPSFRPSETSPFNTDWPNSIPLLPHYPH